MDILEKLFGTAAKVKMMRLFLFNADKTFELKAISKMVKVELSKARKEALGLAKAGMISKTKSGYKLNSSFPYLEPLQKLLIHLSPVAHKEIVRRISQGGRIKVIVVSGLFIEEWDSRIDILVAGDSLKRNVIDQAMKTIEFELGKEIKYAVLDTKDFKYRVDVGDRLVRDVFDYPHKILIDKIGL